MQVNLATSSIRPGQPSGWQAALQDTLQSAVASSKAAISVFTGTWQHDVDQAQLLAHYAHVQIKVCAQLHSDKPVLICFMLSLAVQCHTQCGKSPAADLI